MAASSKVASTGLYIAIKRNLSACRPGKSINSYTSKKSADNHLICTRRRALRAAPMRSPKLSSRPRQMHQNLTDAAPLARACPQAHRAQGHHGRNADRQSAQSPWEQVRQSLPGGCGQPHGWPGAGGHEMTGPQSAESMSEPTACSASAALPLPFPAHQRHTCRADQHVMLGMEQS